MKEIIKIQNKDGQDLVNARELHEALEIGRDFSNWIKDRIGRFDLTENVDYVPLAKNGEACKAGSNRIDYFLTISCAKELCMVQNNEKGKMIRKYFIECEKQLKEKNEKSPCEILVEQSIRLLAQERAILATNERLNAVELLAIQANSYNSSNTGFITVRGFCNVKKIKLGLRNAQKLGKIASKLSKELETNTKKATDEVFGEVNSHPVELLEEAYEIFTEEEKQAV